MPNCSPAAPPSKQPPWIARPSRAAPPLAPTQQGTNNSGLKRDMAYPWVQPFIFLSNLKKWNHFSEVLYWKNKAGSSSLNQIMGWKVIFGVIEKSLSLNHIPQKYKHIMLTCHLLYTIYNKYLSYDIPTKKQNHWFQHWPRALVLRLMAKIAQRFWNWYKNSISGIISGAGFFPPTVWTAMLVHGYWGPLWMLHSTLLNPNRHSTEEGCIFNQDSGWLKHSPCGHGGDPRSPTGLSYFGNVLLHWLQQNSNTPDQWRRDCCQASCWVPSPTPDLDEFQDQKIKAIRQSIVKISFNPGTT